MADVVRAMIPAALSVDLRKTFRPADAPAFTLAVRFCAEPGTTAIFGASGSGKSTLLECMAGLQEPDEGQIICAGQSFYDAHTGVNLPPRHRRIGYLFQSMALFPHMTVQQNVEYGLQRLPAGERATIARNALEQFHVAALAQKRPAAISGGEQQRVALARALVTSPELLLLDEPFSALDYSTKAKIMDDLRRWQSDHPIPVLLVTHALEEVLALAGRVLVLQEGGIVADGKPATVLAGQRERLLNDLALSSR